MATFNKILNPVYSAISGFTMNSDGSMNVTYAIGTGTEEAEQITEFRPLVTEYKYLDSTQAHAIMFAPLTQGDIVNPSNITLTHKPTYRSYKGEQGKIAPNLLQRDFSASKPNEKWLTDITKFSMKDEKRYFSPILDCFNNERITYGLSRRSNSMLVQEMLLQAMEKLPRNANLILHSDQGIHYQMPNYQRLLAKNRISQSMSRKGNCLDNAAMESFLGRMKTECFHEKSFTNIDELEKVINDYVRYYNEERIQLKLKGLSPIQYRKQSFK